MTDLAALEKMFQNFRIIGSNGVDVAGSVSKGYAANCNCGNEVSGTGGGIPPTPTTPTGACCVGTSCSITTESECTGTYQGDNTTCSPDPCSPTGACCQDGDCSITTEAECSGTYQGDDTVCDPNPCVGPDCGTNSVTLCKCGEAAFPCPDGGYASSVSSDCGGPISNYSDCLDTRGYFLHRLNTFTYCGGPEHDPCVATSDFTYTLNGSFECEGPVQVDDGNCPFNPQTVEQELSSEYTTATLIANAFSLLGPCPDGCVQTAELSEDEACCTASCVSAFLPPP